MSVVLPSRALPGTGTAPKTMYCGVYQASVVNINDPQNRGRIQMKVPQILGTATSNWANPLGLAIVNVPTAGTLVYAAFIGGDVNHPVYWTVNSSITVTSITTGSITLKNGVNTSTITASSDNAHAIFSKAIELAPVSTPSTPSTGIKLWSDTNGKFNFKGTNGLAEFAQNIIIDGTFRASSTSEFDGTITLKNGSNTSTITIATDGHPVFSQALELGQTTTPGTPGTGVKIWSDTNNKLNFKGSNGLAEFAQNIVFDLGASFASISTPSTPASGIVMWADSDILPRYRGTDGSVYGMGKRMITFTSSQTVSSSTMVTINDGTNNFSATVSAGKYRFRARIIYEPSGTSGNPSFGITSPAFSSGGAIFTLQFNGIASGFARYDNTSPFNSSFAGPNNSTVTASVFVAVDIEGTAVFTAGGTLAMRAQTGGGSNFVIQQGSFFFTEPL